jgi:hypothetical protein
VRHGGELSPKILVSSLDRLKSGPICYCRFDALLALLHLSVCLESLSGVHDLTHDQFDASN